MKDNSYLRKIPDIALERGIYNDFPDSDKAFKKKFDLRPVMTKRYAWAIPTAQAIRTICKYSPLVEIGAGTGYWAWLLQRAGADIIPYDSHPPRENLLPRLGRNKKAAHLEIVRNLRNHYGHEKAWTRVLRGGPEMVNRHPWRNLFLCWPPYSDPMAEKALRRFLGQFVIYIGEQGGGCTATDEFHDLLENEFEEIENVRIPQWWAIRDCLTVWRRKEGT